MFQGFYTLTSGMLTQTRNLNVISNNMVNVSTPGYKNDNMIVSTFAEEMVARNNTHELKGEELGRMGKIVTADRNYTDYVSGALEPTGRTLDFAMRGQGFFTIQTDDGPMYTRNGSFSIDDTGYLMLEGVGQVLGETGPIFVGTDDIVTDSLGNIFNNRSNQYLGKLAIADFADYDAELSKDSGNVFKATGTPIPATGTVMQNTIESSNVDSVKEMVAMMSSQRALSSNAQILKMYDEMTGKMLTKLGQM